MQLSELDIVDRNRLEQALYTSPSFERLDMKWVLVTPDEVVSFTLGLSTILFAHAEGSRQHVGAWLIEATGYALAWPHRRAA